MVSAREVKTEPVIANSFLVEQFSNCDLNTPSPTRLRYHQLLLIERGTGTLSIDERSFSLHSRDLILMSKGQIYKFENPSIISGYRISFGDCFWEKTPSSASNCKAVLFNNAAVNQQLILSSLEMSAVCVLFENLLTEYKAPEYINQIDVLAAYLKVIMIKLANVKLPQQTTFDSQDYILYRNFLDLLSAKFQTYHAVNDYAVRLSVTARRLSEICKRCSGRTAKEIIIGQIIAESKRLLQFSSTTVKEIAYTLNFSSSEQFSHFFKKNTKIAPAEYRNQFIQIGA